MRTYRTTLSVMPAALHIATSNIAASQRRCWRQSISDAHRGRRNQPASTVPASRINRDKLPGTSASSSHHRRNCKAKAGGGFPYLAATRDIA
jgi:hypothetical protein